MFILLQKAFSRHGTDLLLEGSRTNILFTLPSTKKTHESRYTLNLFTDRLLADLKKFSPRVLQKDEIYSVFYRLLNPSDRTLKIAQEAKTSAVKSDKSPNYLGDFLAVSRIHLQKNGLLKFEGGGNNLGYLAVLPVTKWGKNCTDELVDIFLAVDSQLTLVQQIVSKNPFLTIRSLEQRQKSSVIKFFAYLGLVTADVVAAQDEEFEEYKSLLSTQSSEQKKIPFDYEIYALLYNEDEYALLESVSALQKKIYQNHQVHLLHERNMPTHYFFQSLPGEIKFTRPTLFLSSQVSHLLSIFESPPQGLERTDWGEGAVMVLPQANSNHTYNFNFHVKEDKASPGHTLVIGQTGSGKSFVSHILASMGLRYPNVRVFLLDSHNGAASMVHSLGGKYLDIGGGGAGVESVRLNPLLLDLKKEKNASFLFSWLDTLMASDFQDDEMSRYEKCKNTFLRRLKDEARSNRQLGIVKDFFGADEMSEKIRASIQKFTSGEYRQTFNNEEDGLDFSNNRLFGIEMGQILKHSGMKGADDLINAIVPYITHKIDGVSEDVGGASLIFFDETANLLRNEETKKWFVKQTQQGRKQRQAIIAAFQEPDTIIKSDVSDVIMTNFPRQILFAGMNISKKMANIFQLTDREQFFLQGRMPNSERKILVRARTEDKVESVILDVDFSTIAQQPDAPNIRRIFDTMTEALPLIRRIQNETPAGEDWRSRYWAIK